jgi:hypothetical protein
MKIVTFPAEWYADPANGTRPRCLDGQDWAGHVATHGVHNIAPQQPTPVVSTPDSSPPELGPLTKRERQGPPSRARVLAVLATAALVVALAGCGSSGAGGIGGSSDNSGVGVSSGLRPSSFATPGGSLCASIGSGWYGASAFGTGTPVCTLVTNDKTGETMTVSVVNLQAGATEPFKGTTPSLDALIRQDEQEESSGWTERFAIPGYDLAGVFPGGTAEAYAYASDGTVLECQADLEGPEDVGAFRSRCAAAFKVLAPR